MILPGNADTETRIALLEQATRHICESVAHLEHAIERRFDAIDHSMDWTRSRLEKINDIIWKIFLWLLGAIFSISAGGIGILLKALGVF